MSTLGVVLLVILALVLVGVIPVWPHNREWGYAPGGLFLVLLIIVLVMVLAGKL